jgi:CspA family cold shock protein
VARSGSSLGTVIRWDEHRHGGLVEAPDLPGLCWVDATVVARGAGGESLRAGQIVEIDWTEPGIGGAPLRATRVVPRVDLQTGLGG